MVRTVCVLILSVTLAIAVASPAAATEYDCGEVDFTLSPTNGPPGTTVQLGGNEAWPNDSAGIYWDNVFLATIMSDGTGVFSYSFAVPGSAPPGVHSVIFDGYDENDDSVFCDQNFTVTEVPLQPDTDTGAGTQGATDTQQATTGVEQSSGSSKITSLPATGFPLPLAGVAAALAAGGLALTAFGNRR